MNLDGVEANPDKAADLLKALANRSRLLILCELQQGERSVTALSQRVGLSQSALSQHLARLRAEGIVETRRDMQTIYYSIANPDVTIIMDALCSIYRAPPCIP